MIRTSDPLETRSSHSQKVCCHLAETGVTQKRRPVMQQLSICVCVFFSLRVSFYASAHRIDGAGGIVFSIGLCIRAHVCIQIESFSDLLATDF